MVYYPANLDSKGKNDNYEDVDWATDGDHQLKGL